MAAQQFNATPEQLAVLIEFCRRRVQEHDFYASAELRAAVEAVSGPCFREIDGEMVAVNSDGTEA